VDSREAKEILSCYRPGLDDTADPRFAEALLLARTDPALARWLEEQTAFDAAVREQVRRIPVPHDLREKILTRRRAGPRATVWWWRNSWWQAAAAGLAVLALVSSFWLANRSDPFDAYRRDMAGLVSGEYEMNLKTSHLDRIRDFLTTSGWPSDYALTPAMQNLEAEGASVLHWRGRKVSLICLEAGEDEDDELFLFVVEGSIFRDAPATQSPQFERVGEMTTAAWSTGNKVYFLASHGDEQFLQQYL
jgi:hypothetical protein